MDLGGECAQTVREMMSLSTKIFTIIAMVRVNIFTRLVILLILFPTKHFCLKYTFEAEKRN